MLCVNRQEAHDKDTSLWVGWWQAAAWFSNLSCLCQLWLFNHKNHSLSALEINPCRNTPFPFGLVVLIRLVSF